jgi:hypothetical protein
MMKITKLKKTFANNLIRKKKLMEIKKNIIDKFLVNPFEKFIYF